VINPNEHHLITYDPGAAASGWTHFIIDRRAFSRPEHKLLRWLLYWNCGEFTGTEHEQLRQATRLMDGALKSVSYLALDVLSENFDLTQLIGGSNLLSPVRFNAVLDWECAKRAIRLELQARQMRTGVTHERLKLYGFEGKFRKDEFAAMQHGVTKLRLMKQLSKQRPWKLSEGGALNAHYDCACHRRKKCDLIHP
jgi:hypothetical protein